MTASPSNRYRGRQPQIRYTPTTSQTKRLSDPAQLAHGKPSSRVAWNASSAVWINQPMRTPQVAARPAAPGRRASPKYANAASPYASSTGQNSSSATTLDLVDLATEARELGSHDREPREHHCEHDDVRRRRVLLARAHRATGSATCRGCAGSRSARRSSRSRASRRLPSSSTL